jgi:hypothetical protein
MAHVYAIVVTDEAELGSDLFAERVNERMTAGGVGVNWLSNPLIVSGSPDDFHAIVLAHGDTLDSLDAEDKPRTLWRICAQPCKTRTASSARCSTAPTEPPWWSA